jgi:predicted metalloendopeptidase
MKNIFLISATALTMSAFVYNADYKALEIKHMDTTMSPTEDFYTYVNGKWMETAEIPSDRGRWGSFDELGKKADSMALDVLESALKGDGGITYSPATDQGKAVMLYQTVIDIQNRNKQGTEPIKKYLQEIENIQNKKELINYTIKYMPYGENTFIGFYVGADAKNSNKNVMYLGGGGLGLPDRDYYLKTDEKSVGIQTAYKKYITDVFTAFGYGDNAATTANRIFDMEKQLAAAKMTKEERRDPNKSYNPISLKKAKKQLNQFNLDGMLAALGVKPDTFIVGEVALVNEINKMVKKSNITDLKNFMLWGTMRGSMGLLSEDLEKMSFNFYGKTLRGTPAQRPLKERALNVVNGTLGEALGKLYVEKYFPSEAKAVAKEMVDNVIAAYRVRINQLDWMSEATKKKANLKLDKLTVKIGYPDKWKSYAKLNLASYQMGGSYFENMMNASKFSVGENMAEFGKPVDKTEWMMSPQTVNAYYNPLYNEIVFPAAILQAPFFDFRNDPAVNYGGIGAVIGHEISHGFDDAGAQFDENGNLVNWWTPEDLKAFKEKGKKLADQYSKYEALPGKFVNGEFTLGENIGDLGGVASAFDGLMLKNKGSKIGLIDGFTQEQRFFLSWATIWRGKIRDAELAMRLVTDPHSPGYFRAIGPLQNHEGYYKAFGVKEGNKMYRSDADRVKIW